MNRTPNTDSSRRQADIILVIGLEAFVSAQDYATYLSEMCYTIADHLGLELSFVTGNGVPCFGDLLRFHPHEEYRLMIGDDRYRLETVK